MEFLRRNLFRFVTSSTNRAFLNVYETNIKFFSTNVEKVTDQTKLTSTDQHESNEFMLTSTDTEPDKLYKFLELELRGNDPAVLRSYQKFAVTTGNHLGIENKTWTPRKPLHERYTVLKSVHIYKKHRVQYEYRTYFLFVQYSKLTGSTADTLLEYLERNLPEGVALKATKVEIQKIPDYLEPPK